MYGQTSTSKRIDPPLYHIKGKPRDDGMLDRHALQLLGRTLVMTLKSGRAVLRHAMSPKIGRG